MKIRILLFLLVLAAAVTAADAAPGRFFALNPTEEMIVVMDDPGRAGWQKPDQVLDALGLKSGDVVADIGAGSGYFTIFLARRVGETGRVLAIDTDPKMVAEIERKAQAARLPQIRAYLGASDDPNVAPRSADTVFICNTYPLLDGRVGYLRKVREVMKDRGRLVIISYNQDADILDAPPPQKRVTREQTIVEAARAGLRLREEHRFLPYQHFLVFDKADSSRTFY